MDEHCARCRTPTRHRAVDETGSVPICGMCVMALMGQLDRSGAVLTFVLETPLVSRVAS